MCVCVCVCVCVHDVPHAFTAEALPPASATCSATLVLVYLLYWYQSATALTRTFTAIIVVILRFNLDDGFYTENFIAERCLHDDMLSNAKVKSITVRPVILGKSQPAKNRNLGRLILNLSRLQKQLPSTCDLSIP